MVAPVAVIALLKMIAYADRLAERERDLADIGYILEEYPPADHPRRFEPEIIQTGLPFELTGSYILGTELEAMLSAEEQVEVRSFISHIRDESDGGIAQARMLRLGPRVWQRNPDELLSRVEAVRRGLERVRGAPPANRLGPQRNC